MSGHSDKVKVEEAVTGYGSEAGLRPQAILDPELNHLQVNDAYADVYGYDPQGMIGLSLSEIIHPADHRTLEQCLLELSSMGIAQGVLKGRRRDGSVFYQQIILQSTLLPDSQEPACRCFMTDITEEKEREKLRLLEQRVLREIAVNSEVETILEDLCRGVDDILEDARCMISLLGDDGVTLKAMIAPGMPGILEHPELLPPVCMEAVQRNQPVLVADVTQDPLWQSHLDLARQFDISASWSNPLYSRDGKVLGSFGIARGRPGLPSELEGEVLRVVGYLCSIALDSHRTLNMLQRYEHMVNASRDMMVYVNRDFTYRAVSNSFAEYAGWQAEDLTGRHIASVIGEELFNGKIRERLESCFKGEPMTRCGRMKIGDKPDLYVTSHYDPVISDGEVIGVVVVIRDDSETQQIEQALQESEERFNLAMRGVNDGLWDWIPDTDTMYYSNTWGRMLGYRDEEYVGSWRDFHELVHEEDRQDVIDRMLSFADSRDDRFELEYRMLHKDGRYLDILSRGYGIRDQDSGRIKRIVGINADISGRKKAEVRLQESERRFRALYDDSPTMFFTLARDGRVLSVNRFGADHLGYSVDQLVGTVITELAHKDDRKRLQSHIEQSLTDHETVHHCEFRAKHKFGDQIWERATLRAIDRDDGSDILMSCEDITETRILSEQLEYQAKHDSLTRLINRAEFERRLRRVLNSDAADSPHAVCYLDLDQFKIINDTCGHLAGDELLRRVSQLLETVVRKRDTLARLGGDEFAVLLEHCPLDQARRVAMNMLEAVKTLRFTWEDKRFNIGVTIGLVPIDGDSGTVTDVLSAADAACYAAKDAGRNRIHVYHTDDRELTKRRGEMQWVSEINSALEDNRLRLALQPIVPLAEGSNNGRHYELLLRLENESGKIIYPGAFLPAAERYNLMTRLDRWVISTAFDWLSNNPQEQESLGECSINLSGHSFGEPEFLDFMLEKFQSEHIDAEKFCFEITETAVIANLVDAIQFISALKEIGCRFALDDFGTGLSSFNYLKNLPVDYLKIDGTFIQGITNDPIDLAMVRSINEIGHVMGKQTIAEFVENEEILEVLRGIGVDYVQGYAVGRPELL